MNRFYAGLDLGQAQDYTALTIIHRVDVRKGAPATSPAAIDATQLKSSRRPEREPSRREELLRAKHREPELERRLFLRHAERFPLGTPYPAIVDRVAAVMKAPQLQGDDPPVCVVDATGVGRPVVDMLAAAKVEPLRAIYITGGDAVSRQGDEYRVPKRDLAAGLQALLQGGRLKFADQLQLRDVLQRELQNFKIKINIATGHDSYEAWRERDHDDVVLSLALACWYAENDVSSNTEVILL